MKNSDDPARAIARLPEKFPAGSIPSGNGFGEIVKFPASLARPAVPARNAVFAGPAVAEVIGKLLPLAPGLTAALDRGINLIQPDCGDAAVLAGLARWFPRSRFAGTCAAGDEINSARLRNRTAALQNLWLVPVERHTQAYGAIFDVALLLDVPAASTAIAALVAVAAQLKPGGVLLWRVAATDAAGRRLASHLLSACGLTLVHATIPAARAAGFACVAVR